MCSALDPDISSEDGRDETPPTVVLILTSHAHSPPLKPAPDLKFDLRSIPNPPKAIRTAYTGVDKRLREHMLAHDGFVALLDQAESIIRARAEDLLVHFHDEQKVEMPGPEQSKQGDEGDKISNPSRSSGEEGNESENEDSAEEPEGNRLLRVGAFCARGRHRSVAFVEELSRRSWPATWEIQVAHRDLFKKMKSNQRGHRKSGGHKAVLDESDADD